MPAPTEVDLDQSGNIKLKFRKGEGRPFTLTFLVDSEAHDISAYGFYLEVFEIDSDEILFTLTEVSGLTNGGAAGTLIIDPTDDQLDLDPKTYEYRLKSTTPNRTWFHGQCPINNSPRTGTGEDSAEVTLDIGDVNVTVNLTIAGFDLDNLTEGQKAALATAIAPYLL